MEHLTDDDILHGGAATTTTRCLPQPLSSAARPRVVILAKTVKGWTLGRRRGRPQHHPPGQEAARGRLRVFRDRLELPIPDAQITDEERISTPARSRTRSATCRSAAPALGGPVPRRVVRSAPLRPLPRGHVDGGSATAVSTTMVFTRLLRNLIRPDEQIGKRMVPVDEARFRLDPLFKEVGIYAAHGPRYDRGLGPRAVVSRGDQQPSGGRTRRAGCASLQAAGTSYATHGEPMIPFYMFYSMFGFQRTGDPGMGLRRPARARLHDRGDGRPDDARPPGPRQRSRAGARLHGARDPGLRPGIAVRARHVVRDGIARMYTDGEDVFYYVTVYNENYPQPAKPDAVDEGIVRGLYRFAAAPPGSPTPRCASASWARARSCSRCWPRGTSSPSGSTSPPRSTRPRSWRLRNEALGAERWNRLNPEKAPRVPYVAQVLGPTAVGSWPPTRSRPCRTSWRMARPTSSWAPTAPGAATRARRTPGALRNRRAEHHGAALSAGLVRRGEYDAGAAAAAIRDLGLDPDGPDALTA